MNEKVDEIYHMFFDALKEHRYGLQRYNVEGFKCFQDIDGYNSMYSRFDQFLAQKAGVDKIETIKVVSGKELESSGQAPGNFNYNYLVYVEFNGRKSVEISMYY